jgi:E3 ubiquitin-protein ligase UBR7
MVVKDDPLYSWSVHGTPTSTQGDTVDIDGTSSDVAGGTTIGIKRPRSSSGTRVLEAKRPRVSSSLPSSCVAPPPDPVAQKVLALCGSSNPNTSLGHGDVFLTEGWRQRWCRCSSVSCGRLLSRVRSPLPLPQCLPSLEAHPFLLEEEETYEPPEDPDSGALACVL